MPLPFKASLLTFVDPFRPIFLVNAMFFCQESSNKTSMQIKLVEETLS